jgi:hypothetical protein
MGFFGRKIRGSRGGWSGRRRSRNWFGRHRIGHGLRRNEPGVSRIGCGLDGSAALIPGSGFLDRCRGGPVQHLRAGLDRGVPVVHVDGTDQADRGDADYEEDKSGPTEAEKQPGLPSSLHSTEGSGRLGGSIDGPGALTEFLDALGGLGGVLSVYELAHLDEFLGHLRSFGAVLSEECRCLELRLDCRDGGVRCCGRFGHGHLPPP